MPITSNHVLSPLNPSRPSKIRPTPQLRTRDNQRRSRARRKEYVEELEKRIHDFERHGAQASVELQAAARKVARENALLRILLRQHGVTSSEIEAYVLGKDGDSGIIPTMSRSLRTIKDSSLGKQLPPEDVTQILALEGEHTVQVVEPRYGPTSSSVHLSNSQMLQGPTVSDLPFHPPPPPSSPLPTVHPSTSQSSPLDHETQDIRHAETNGQLRAKARDDAMSCEAAASIIANLRGYDDTEDVRAELGCPSNADCAVKNLTVFHVMDR